jgi:hypothetical protein
MTRRTPDSLRTPLSAQRFPLRHKESQRIHVPKCPEMSHLAAICGQISVHMHDIVVGLSYALGQRGAAAHLMGCGVVNLDLGATR